MAKTVKVYSKKTEGNLKLSANFKVREFACADGTDIVLIAPDLVILLQAVRDHFGKPVNINSGYRTVQHNKKLANAASDSEHTKGCAADIKISGITPKVVAAYIETLIPNSGGVGIYSNFVHVDTRSKRSRWNG